MRVGIIGTHWGRAHCGIFRRFRHEVAVLVGRDAEATRRVAADEFVPIGTTDLGVLEEVDIVVVATPPRTHASFIRRFPDKIVVCEKPLFGTEIPDDADELVGHPRLFVNYALSFLKTATALRERLPEIGRPRRVEISVEVNLDARRPHERWLTEIAVHPISFVVSLLGEVRRVEAPAGCDVAFADEDCVVEVRITKARQPGIDYRLHFSGEARSAELKGSYRVGGLWNYSALRIDGRGVMGPEESIARDVWYEANCRSVRAMLDVVEGRASMEEARARGLYDGRAALVIDRLLA